VISSKSSCIARRHGPAAHRSVPVIVGGPSKDTCLGGSRHALAAHNLRQRCCRCLPLSPLRSATLRPDEQLRIYTYGTGAVLGAVWQDWRAGCAPNENAMPMRTRGTRESTMAGRDRMFVVWCQSDWLMRVAVLSSTRWIDRSIDRWMDCVRRDARLEMRHVSAMQLAPSRNNTCCEESGSDSVCKKGSCTRGKCIKRRCCNHSRNDTEACRGAYVQMRARV